MSIEEVIKYWIESAEDDLKASINLYASCNYDWCLFIGHLVLEKALKALWVQNSGNISNPKIHNLVRSAELSDISLTKEQEEFLDLVNSFHLETRYSEYKRDFRKIANQEFAEYHLNKIQEYFKWLKSLLK